jgi:hypothetical protein
MHLQVWVLFEEVSKLCQSWKNLANFGVGIEEKVERFNPSTGCLFYNCSVCSLDAGRSILTYEKNEFDGPLISA